MRPLTPLKVLLFGLALAATLGAALLPIFPRQLGLAEGDTASRTIRAPRAVVFESVVLTERAREAAAQAVPAVQVFDPSVVEGQLRALGTATSSVDQVRNSGALDDARKRARLLGIENLTGLSRGSIDTILALDDAAWERVSGEAARVLEDVTGQSIAADAA